MMKFIVEQPVSGSEPVIQASIFDVTQMLGYDAVEMRKMRTVLETKVMFWYCETYGKEPARVKTRTKCYTIYDVTDELKAFVCGVLSGYGFGLMLPTTKKISFEVPRRYPCCPVKRSKAAKVK